MLLLLHLSLRHFIFVSSHEKQVLVRLRSAPRSKDQRKLCPISWEDSSVLIIPSHEPYCHFAPTPPCCVWQESFVRAKNWVKELQRQASPNIVIALAGNKADLANKRALDFQVCVL